MTRILGFALVMMMGAAAMAKDGSSGCGPGWYVFQDNTLVSSAFRSTTNGVLIPVVTIGMTVGTSNCTKHHIVETEKESLHFATMNFFELKGDFAKGEGEYVTAFANVIGCKAGAQGSFNQQMQKNFDRIFPSAAQPEDVLLNVYKVILSDEVLVNKCSLHLS